MPKYKTLNYIGAAIGIAGFLIILFKYDWLTALAILLMITGNNLEQAGRYTERKIDGL